VKWSGAYLSSLLLVSVLLAGGVQAQDAHYWDSQYGTKAELLGGLVVGSSTDLSATYYNPGWIALQTGPSLLLTTKAAEVYNITIKNGTGRGTEPSNTVVTASPGYLAGRFSLGDDYGWKWAYTFLQKVQFQFDARAVRIEENPNPVPEGNIWFGGEGFQTAKVEESWYGVSISRKIAENVAIGFSPYAAIRNQRFRSQVFAQALSANQIAGNAFLVEDVKFWHARLLLKMGVAAEWSRWSAGVAITTPSLGVVGDGSVYENLSMSGDYDPNNPGPDEPYLQASNQEKLEPVWRTPLSIAAGGAVNLGDTRVHLTVEWFDSVDRYSVLNSTSYEVQSDPGEFKEIQVEHGARNVVNYGLGVNHAFTESFSLFTSYRIDRATTPDYLESSMSISVWDSSHVSGGASFELLSLEFTAGLQYSWGDGLTDDFLAFGEDEHGTVIASSADQVVTYRRLKVLLGFNLPFNTPGS
jgi:hypothetical protein